MSDKTLDIVNIQDAKDKIPDISVVGNGDTWQLLCKASSKSENWMKSTKAIQIDNVGCLVQVTTYHQGAISEALSFVPNSKIVADINGGRKLVYTHA